jgi:predicted phage-related endonuclease
MKQGSKEWLQARCGKATASRFCDVVAKIRTGEAAARKQYRAQLLCERLTGLPVESFVNAAMQWGRQQEPVARALYEAITGDLVSEVGFIPHAELMAGASPDGLIGDDGCIEIKCPTTAVHLDTLMKGMAAEHHAQVQGVLWITGRQWCDFVSFDPRLPEPMQLYMQRIERDEIYIARLEEEIVLFLGELEAAIAALTERIAA